MNEKQEDEMIRAAFVAGRNGIVSILTKDAGKEIVLEVIMLMAHNVLTHGETFDINISNHNAEIFCNRLKQLIAETQKDIAQESYIGRLM